MSQNLYTLSLDSVKYICSLINKTVDLPNTILDDLHIQSTTTYSSYKLDTLLKALKDENIAYCDAAIAGLNKLSKEIITDKSQITNENTIYLLLKDPVNNIYEQWLLINGTPQMIGTTEMKLDSVYTKEEADDRYALLTDYKTLREEVVANKTKIRDLTTTATTLKEAVSELKGTKLNILQDSDKSGNIMTVGGDGLITADTPFIESFDASRIFLKGDKTNGAIQAGSLYVIGGQIALLTGYFYVLPTITVGWNTLSKISTSWKYKPISGHDAKAAASGYNSTDKKRLFTHIQVNSSGLIGYFTDEDTSITVNTGLQFGLWFPVQLR